MNLRGLYAITPDRFARPRPLEELVEAALAGGAVLIQYRDKGKDTRRREREARSLLHLCRDFGVPLLINDDLALARRISAQGVHLGRGDADPREARRLLGAEALIGFSCYNQFQRAQQAKAWGLDYLAFGRFFPSRTKPQAAQADPALLVRAKRELGLPLVAIGGLTPENSPPLIAAGADLLAVVDGVFAAPDVQAAAQAFTDLFQEH